MRKSMHLTTTNHLEILWKIQINGDACYVYGMKNSKWFKMPILCKLFYQCDAIPIKVLTDFFFVNITSWFKIQMNEWSNLNGQISFKMRNLVITLPYLKGYYKSKDSQNNQQSRIEESRNIPIFT